MPESGRCQCGDLGLWRSRPLEGVAVRSCDSHRSTRSGTTRPVRTAGRIASPARRVARWS